MNEQDLPNFHLNISFLFANMYNFRKSLFLMLLKLIWYNMHTLEFLKNTLFPITYKVHANKNLISYSKFISQVISLHKLFSHTRVTEKSATLTDNPASIYLLKVNNRNTRRRCEIFSELTINIPERRYC